MTDQLPLPSSAADADARDAERAKYLNALVSLDIRLARACAPKNVSELAGDWACYRLFPTSEVLLRREAWAYLARKLKKEEQHG
jgi:hypothetical protein